VAKKKVGDGGPEFEPSEPEWVKHQAQMDEWGMSYPPLRGALLADLSRNAAEVVFQGRWPPQRRLADNLLVLNELIQGLLVSLSDLRRNNLGPEERHAVSVRLCEDYGGLFEGVWYLGQTLEDTRPSIGQSAEWRETYAVWCGLRLQFKTPPNESREYFTSGLEYLTSLFSDTWCGPLVVCAGRLAAAGNLGEPGPVTEWSPPMTRHRLASILDVSEKTIDRWIERGEAVGKGIKREGRGRFKLTIQALDSKSLERFRKAFPASK
jgi:hypothetical protein